MNLITLFKNWFDQRVLSIIEAYLLRTHKIFGESSRVQISDSAHVCNALFNTASGTITIEDYVIFGHDVLVLTGTHNYHKTDKERIVGIPNMGRDVIIRKGAWIGSGTIIIGPCDIGENSVIAAGSVVVNNVPANEVHGGNPARYIKGISKN